MQLVQSAKDNGSDDNRPPATPLISLLYRLHRHIRLTQLGYLTVTFKVKQDETSQVRIS